MSNCYQTLDGKIIRECAQGVLQYLISILTYHRSYLQLILTLFQKIKDAYRHKKKK